MDGPVHDRSMDDDGAPDRLMRECPQFLLPPSVRFRAAIPIPIGWTVCVQRGLRPDTRGTTEGD